MKAADRAKARWKRNPRAPKVVKRIGKTVYFDDDPTPRTPRGKPRLR